MKTISLGDTHGNPAWKTIDPAQYDHIIFIGDYSDSESLTDEDELINFQEIVDFKKAYPEKVRLILGNHDLNYIYFPDYKCSRFRPLLQPALTKIFQEDSNFFEAAFQIKNFLWTHAGVSKSWLTSQERQPTNFSTLANFLNELNADPITRKALHSVGPLRGGKAKHGGITWADQMETENDFLDGVHQIVGHSRVKDITTMRNETGSITYIDCLEEKTEFYEVVIL